MKDKCVESTRQASHPKKEAKKTKKEKEFLELVSRGKLFVDSREGDDVIFYAKDVFRAYIDSEFGTQEMLTVSDETERTMLDAYRIINPGTISELFKSISTDLEELILTPDQIISFCERNLSWFAENSVTFFLIKVGKRYRAIEVHNINHLLGINLTNLTSSIFQKGKKWYEGDNVRIIIPNYCF